MNFFLSETDKPEEYNHDFEVLKRRCFELIEKYPEKKSLFEDYIYSQEEEYDVIENKIVCSTMLIKRI